jgi:1-acyl-sn-glycerol-3-phosphate acyltransferase
VRARLTLASRLERVPPERLGFRLEAAARLFLLMALLYRRYFRVECHGIDALPDGGLLLVANHGSHVLSWGGPMIVSACLLDAEPPRLVHGMASRRVMALPVVGAAARSIGAVEGRRTVCEDLLRAGGAVLTFPEGSKMLERPSRDRYRLRAFRHGFMHAALSTGAPIVPVAVIGAEGEAPLVVNASWLARLMRTPAVPLSSTLFVPLPAKYHLHFGAPRSFVGPATPDVVARYAEEMRTALEELIRQGLDMRQHRAW